MNKNLLAVIIISQIFQYFSIFTIFLFNNSKQGAGLKAELPSEKLSVI